MEKAESKVNRLTEKRTEAKTRGELQFELRAQQSGEQRLCCRDERSHGKTEIREQPGVLDRSSQS